MPTRSNSRSKQKEQVITRPVPSTKQLFQALHLKGSRPSIYWKTFPPKFWRQSSLHHVNYHHIESIESSKMLPASSTDIPCTVPNSLDLNTSPQWDKYHADVSQRHWNLPGPQSREPQMSPFKLNIPTTGYQCLSYWSQKIHGYFVQAKACISAFFLWRGQQQWWQWHDTNFARGWHHSHQWKKITSWASMWTNFTTNCHQANAFYFYFYQPLYTLFMSVKEPDGTFKCHKCTQFMHNPKIANQVGFDSLTNLWQHLWEPFMHFNFVWFNDTSLAVITSILFGMTWSHRCLSQTLIIRFSIALLVTFVSFLLCIITFAFANGIVT